MAILTTGFNISQSGLTPDAVNISFSGMQLTVEAPAVSQGGATITKSTHIDVNATNAKATFVYIINKSATGGGIVTLGDAGNPFGRLQPGEWAFLPLDVSTVLRVSEVGGSHDADVEYCYFTRA